MFIIISNILQRYKKIFIKHNSQHTFFYTKQNTQFISNTYLQTRSPTCRDARLERPNEQSESQCINFCNKRKQKGVEDVQPYLPLVTKGNLRIVNILHPPPRPQSGQTKYSFN